MKFNFKRITIATVAVTAMMLAGCSRVDVGYVGVKVNKLGSDSGVNEEVVGVGYEFIPPTKELFQFPTFTQNEVWTRDSTEGSKYDESITFQSANGLDINADIGISYRVDPEKVATLFQKYRLGIDEITDVYLRNMVRDGIVEFASSMDVEQIYGNGKIDLMNKTEESVQAQVEEFGIIIEKIYWIGTIRLPDQVIASINAKIEATQAAQKRENEVATAIAQAKINRETAQGEADALILAATARAEALDLEGQAIARNPQVIELRGVEKWDGKLPVYNGGGAVPFIDVTQK